MKHLRKNILIRTICRTAILAAMLMPLTVFAADPKIDLKIYESDGGYKLAFVNSECPSDPTFNGCINVAQGSKNWLQWEIDIDDWQDGWDLTALQISWSDPQVATCAVKDFNLDPQTGDANDFRIQGSGKFAKNWDENDCAFAYEVNYRIYARNRNTGEEANSDPVIRNGGRN